MSVLEQARADQASGAAVVVPGAKAVAGPGMIAFGGRLYVAWGDASTFALYASSAKIGEPFSEPAAVNPPPGSTTKPATDGAVALTVFDGQLAIGWNDPSSREQLLGFMNVASGGFTLTGNPVSFGVSNRGPALEPFDGRLALAFKATVSASDEAAPLHIRFSLDGKTFGAATAIKLDAVEVVSRWRPALAVLNERLYLAWTAKSDKYVNIASSEDGVTWEHKATLRDAPAAFGPGLAVVEHRLHVVWTQDTSVATSVSPDGRHWSPARLLDGAASGHAPEVAASSIGRLFAWTEPESQGSAVHVGYGRDLPEPPTR